MIAEASAAAEGIERQLVGGAERQNYSTESTRSVQQASKHF